MTETTLGSSYKNVRIFAILLGVAMSFLFLLASNPGYFNHDELQRADYVKQSGLLQHLIDQLGLYQGDTFGTPLRPLGFLILGGLAYFMDSYPSVVHVFAILVHVTVAFVFFSIMTQFRVADRLALLVAIMFVVNPLSMLATGWTAAVMDQWYLLFGLLTLLFADRYVRKSQSIGNVAGVFLFSALAVLTKETAIILPGLLIVLWAAEPRLVKQKGFWIALSAWVAPVALYLAYRLPAIATSLGSPAVVAYKPSLVNVPENIAVYFSYPFLFSLGEIGNWVFVDGGYIAFFFCFHLVLVALIYSLFGARLTFAYIALYFMLLGPVLLLPGKGGHYMYGSSLVLSAGITCVCYYGWSKHLAYRLFSVLGIALLVLHSIVLQKFIYGIGFCMDRAMTTAASVYLSNGRPAGLDFQAEPGAPKHILHRIATSRNRVGDWYPVRLTVSQLGEKSPSGSLTVFMDRSCFVHSGKIN